MTDGGFRDTSTIRTEGTFAVFSGTKSIRTCHLHNETRVSHETHIGTHGQTLHYPDTVFTLIHGFHGEYHGDLSGVLGRLPMMYFRGLLWS